MKKLFFTLLFVSISLATTLAQNAQADKAGKICMEGSRLFIVVPNYGFSIYDVSEIRSPKELRFVELPGIVDIVARGEYVYANQYQDLLLIKVPQNPDQEVREIKRRTNIFPSRRVDNPAEPLQYSSFDAYRKFLDANPDASPAPSVSVNGSMSCITLSGDYVYAVDGQELKTLNAKPTSSDLFKSTHTEMLSGEVLESIWTDGSARLYLGSQTGLHIFDNLNRAEPKLLGSYRHQRSCDPVVVVGSIAYSTQRNGRDCAGGVNQLDVVDISNPARPTRIRNYPLTNPHGLAAHNNMVMVCDGADGLKVFDTTNPSNLQQEAKIDGITAYDVLYNSEKNAAYVSVPRELHIFSMAQKSSPARQSVIVLPIMPVSR